VVRFATAARDVGLPTIIGAELGVDVALPRTKTERAIAARAGIPDPPGRHLLVLARDTVGYAALCRVISRAQLRGGAKGRPQYDWDGATRGRAWRVNSQIGGR
jgi:error-prone DNA polymerase